MSKINPDTYALSLTLSSEVLKSAKILNVSVKDLQQIIQASNDTFDSGIWVSSLVGTHAINFINFQKAIQKLNKNNMQKVSLWMHTFNDDMNFIPLEQLKLGRKHIEFVNYLSNYYKIDTYPFNNSIRELSSKVNIKKMDKIFYNNKENNKVFSLVMDLFKNDQEQAHSWLATTIKVFDKSPSMIVKMTNGEKIVIRMINELKQFRAIHGYQ